MQCCCDSTSLNCPIPGMYLAKAKIEYGIGGIAINPGDYLLGYVDDPIVIIRPSERQCDVEFIDPETSEISEYISCKAFVGYRLVKDCIKAGYRKKYGSLEYWLLKKLKLKEVTEF